MTDFNERDIDREKAARLRRLLADIEDGLIDILFANHTELAALTVLRKLPFKPVVMKLFELGVPFQQPEDQRYVFKSSFD